MTSRRWFVPCSIVVGVAVVANLLYLTGLFDPNPINIYSGLAESTKPGLLPGLSYADPNIGYTAQTLGHRAALSWLHGHVPWWNPFEGLGAPLAAEMQSAAFFPLVLLDALSAGQELFRLALEITAGLSTLFLLLRLVRSRAAATAGAVVFTLNGSFAWLFHAPGNPVAFAPMMILGVEQARDGRRGVLSGWPLIAVALALSVYAGFPETAFIDLLFASLWSLVRLSELRGAAFRRLFLRLLAGGLTGALLAAPLLLAFAEFLPYADTGGHSGGGFANSWLAPSLALPGVMLPYVYGPIFGEVRWDHTGTLTDFWGNIGGYLGTSLLVLALIGLCGRRDRRLRLALAIWVMIAIGRTVGAEGASQIVNAVPGMKLVAFFRYSEPTWTMALTVLAAFAIDEMTRRRRLALTTACTAAGIGAVGYLGYQALQIHKLIAGTPHHRLWAFSSIAFGVLVAMACWAVAWPRSGKVRATGLAAIMSFEALAFFVVPQLSAPRSATLDKGPVEFLQRHLGDKRVFTLGPLQPNYGSYWGIATVTINDLPIVKSYSRYITTYLNPNAIPTIFVGNRAKDPHGPSPMSEFITNFRNYEQAGVKYVVLTGGSLPPPVPGVPLKVVFSDKIATIVELPNPAPFQSTSGGQCEVVSSTETTASIECVSAGTLIRREQYLPGWIALDNGRQARVAPYEKVFQAVALRPGRNQLEFSYEAPHITVALAAFAIGASAVVAGACGLTGPGGIARFGKRRPFPPPDPTSATGLEDAGDRVP